MDTDDTLFLFPKEIKFEEHTLTNTYGKLIAEPLERGFGTTIGNSLRRVLLSSIEGVAVTSINIENAFHEFSTLKGVVEDLVQITFNLKKLRFRMKTNEEVVAFIDVVNKDRVTSLDIKADADLEPLDPNAVIATLDKGAEFKAELRIRKGKGYVPASDVDKEGLPFGTIFVDAIFSPIKKVFFNVEKTRVGKSTDYDKLILEIWTDGTITPQDALGKATKIVIEHMRHFLVSEEEEVVEEVSSVEEVEPETVAPAEDFSEVETSEDFNLNLLKVVDELELSVRSHNCLKNANIMYIYELVQKSEQEMLKTKNFGRKSLRELEEILQSMGLSFYMRVDMDAVQRELEKQKKVTNAT